MNAPHSHTCIAPVDDDGHLCGKPATTQRTIEDLLCPLCEEHADEIDNDRALEASNAN
jgi:Zn finger protein HypA/HybF involved in hydrogenase expression